MSFLGAQNDIDKTVNLCFRPTQTIAALARAVFLSNFVPTNYNNGHNQVHWIRPTGLEALIGSTVQLTFLGVIDFWGQT